MTKQKNIILIDGYNLFFRAFSSNPTVSQKGKPFGGTVGFIQSIQKYCRLFEPEYIIVAWDQNGAERRRKIFPSYKDETGKKSVKLNRYIETTIEEEKRFQDEQLISTMEYLNALPIIQIMMEETEADDIIAFVSNSIILDSYKKIIISSDKDYLQLVDDKRNVVLYRPAEDKEYKEKDILEKYEISTTNFAIARAIIGDISDSIKGIKGAGFKTIAKRFPELKENIIFGIDKVIETAQAKEDKIKLYKEIRENPNLIKVNYELCQLSKSLLTLEEQEEIKLSIEQFESKFNKIEFIKLALRDGIAHLNWDAFLNCMRILHNTIKINGGK